MPSEQYLKTIWQGSVGAACQWLAWQWMSILAVAIAPEYNIQQALLASGLIFISESMITWLRLEPAKDDAPTLLPGDEQRTDKDRDTAEAPQTLSVPQQSSSACCTFLSVVPNAISGIAFFHIDINTARASHNNLWARCAAVSVGDAIVHYTSTASIDYCLQKNQAVSSARWAALDAGINALAYTLAEHLAGRISDHLRLNNSVQRNTLGSISIFCFTLIATKMVSGMRLAQTERDNGIACHTV